MGEQGQAEQQNIDGGAREPAHAEPSTEAPFGIYVHFPYCLSKCPYCDFASKAVSRVPHARYADGVLRELELRTPEFPSSPASSVFFGGGTPSLWEPEQVARVLRGLRAVHPFREGIEITLEANPGAADEARFVAYRKAGVNRLSIGAQSFAPGVLRTLGRLHGPDDVVRAVQRARAAGFDNVSVDLIYGAPGHTPASVRDDARRAVDLGTEHLSAYALTLVHLAEEVPMARARASGQLAVPDDDAQAEMGAVLREELTAAGLCRYEISNFARPGRESRHNLLYWRGGSYLALGVGASGHLLASDGRSGLRYMNVRTPEQWFPALEDGRLPERERELLCAQDLFHERLFTGLRLVEGLDLAALDALCGTRLLVQQQVLLAELARAGLARFDGRRLALTDAGLDLHTDVAGRLAS